jgi:hypothetical protein
MTASTSAGYTLKPDPIIISLARPIKLGDVLCIPARRTAAFCSQDQDRRPTLHIDLMLVDHRKDLLMEGIDVALQFAPLADSSATPCP